MHIKTVIQLELKLCGSIRFLSKKKVPQVTFLEKGEIMRLFGGYLDKNQSPLYPILKNHF